ncbi:MAG: HindVP family restriction endonuclease [Candidatus Altimarinota bacterium]
MNKKTSPALFGINHSNRDFSKKDNWGKNQFNSSFPAALACFMASKNIDLKYIKINKQLKVEHEFISTSRLFGEKYDSENLYFAFERDHAPFQKLVVGNLPRIDLVTMDLRSGECLRGIEIKLTAIPDNSTCNRDEGQYSCEIVVRPDTIVYMALSIIIAFEKEPKILQDRFSRFYKIKDWTEGLSVLPHLDKMIKAMDELLIFDGDRQSPLVMQPVWKTNGKSALLADGCLDIFVWSDFAFTRLFFDVAKKELKQNRGKISRQVRSVIWLTKMLTDYSKDKIVDHKKIIDELSYNTKNDKAFAVSGRFTYPYLKSEEQSNPRVKKTQIKEIILGGGQQLLSPERRLDGIIQNTPNLFDN